MVLECSSAKNLVESRGSGLLSQGRVSEGTRFNYTGIIPPLSNSTEKRTSKYADLESLRLAALHALGHCHQPPDERFSSITKLMGSIFKTPLCMISLIGEEEVEVKSVHGFIPHGTCAARIHSVCTSILISSSPEVLVVPDLTRDARFADMIFVREPPYLRFYAGSPLVGSGGCRYGTLCVVDLQPRTFPPYVLTTLVNFAELATRELEREREILSISPTYRSMRHAHAYEQPIALLDMSRAGWEVIWGNPAWKETTKATISQDYSSQIDDEGRPTSASTFWGLFRARSTSDTADTPLTAAVQAAFAAQRPVRLAVQCCASDREVSVVLRPATDSIAPEVPVGIPALYCPPKHTRSSGRDSPSAWFAIIEHFEKSRAPPVVKPRQQQFLHNQNPENPIVKKSKSTSGKEMRYSESSSSSCCSPNSGLMGLRDPAPYNLRVPERYQGLILGPLLGAGSFARVHRAQWNDHSVAVKVIDVVPHKNEADVRAMMAEALLPSDVLDHKNIVQLLDFCRTQHYDTAFGATSSLTDELLRSSQSVWILMEFCNRGRLADAIARGWLMKEDDLLVGSSCSSTNNTPDLSRILRTSIDIASALAHVHEHGIVHGDLSCANILLASDESDPRGYIAKISDFGLSCQMESADAPMTTRRHGTLTYMPPELLAEGILSSAVDIYSLGVCMWEMFTCASAYSGQHSMDIIVAVSSGEGELPLPNTVHPGFKSLLERCLAKDHSLRPSASVVEAEARALLHSLPQSYASLDKHKHSPSE